MSDAPTFQAVALGCGKCHHEWIGHIAVQCSMTMAAASMRDIVDRGCPECRWNGVVLNLGKKVEQDG